MKRKFLSFILLALSIMAFARQPERGYRAFVDWSNTLHIEFNLYESGPTDSYFFTGFSTSHGYQFNSHLFVGGGFGFEYTGKHNKSIIPIYAHIRSDLKFGHFTPFAEARLGANLSDGGGMYFSPSIGYRFNWGRRVAINLGLGASFWGTQMDKTEYIMAPEGGITGFEVVGHYHSVHIKPAVRLGVEF